MVTGAQRAFQRVTELNKDKEEDIEEATKTQADYKPLKGMPFLNNKDKAFITVLVICIYLLWAIFH